VPRRGGPGGGAREKGERERGEREREREIDKRVRALRHARGHTLGFIGVCNQVAVNPHQEQVPALAAHYRRFGIECDELLMEEEHSNWRVGAEGEGKWVQVLSPYA
jgi:hypothetical protein